MCVQTLEFGLLGESFVLPLEDGYVGRGRVRNFSGALRAEADMKESPLGLTDNSTPEPHSAMLDPV